MGSNIYKPSPSHHSTTLLSEKEGLLFLKLLIDSLNASDIGKTALVGLYAEQKSCWEWDEEEELLNF